jgi:hypothetical protein
MTKIVSDKCVPGSRISGRTKNTTLSDVQTKGQYHDIIPQNGIQHGTLRHVFATPSLVLLSHTTPDSGAIMSTTLRHSNKRQERVEHLLGLLAENKCSLYIVVL